MGDVVRGMVGEKQGGKQGGKQVEKQRDKLGEKIGEEMGGKRLGGEVAPKIALHAVLILAVAVATTPFLWMVLTSLKEPAELLRGNHFWPRSWTWHNYVEAWQAAPFARYYINSIVIAVATVGLQLFTAALAGYGFARVDMPGRGVIFAAFLTTMMVPVTVTLVPSYLLLNRFGWLNTYAALIVPWGATAFSIFLLRQFFLTLPTHLEDAARIDGCNQIQLLWRIVLPLSKPALLTVATYGWIGSWNDFLWPLIMTDTESMRTLQVGVSVFAQDAGTRYTLQMAAASFTIIPVLIAFFFVQRQFVEGIARTGMTE